MVEKDYEIYLDDSMSSKKYFFIGEVDCDSDILTNEPIFKKRGHTMLSQEIKCDGEHHYTFYVTTLSQIFEHYDKVTIAKIKT
jgi:hypothetical protein